MPGATQIPQSSAELLLRLTTTARRFGASRAAPTRRVRSWLLALLATLFALAVSAGEARLLVVGSEQDFPPFAVGSTEATAGGFTVDLWRAVAKEQGLNFALRVRPFDELLKGFKSGEVDVLLNLASSEDRRAFADFSTTHVEVGGAIFVRDGERRIAAEDQLGGLSLIVLRGDLAHDHAVQRGWAPQLVLVDTAEQGLRLLAAGRHDAMLISKLAGLQTLSQQGIRGVTALDVKVGYSQRFAFAVRKGDAELLSRINEGLALAKTGGVYDRLYEKWFGPYEPRRIGWRDFRPALLGMGLVLLLAGSLAFRSRLIKDRRNAAVLRESEERWKFALEGAGDGVWDANLITGRSLYSRRWKEMLGYREDEIGDAAEEWSGRIHPDDFERVMQDNQECIDGRADSFVSEFRMRAKDQRWVWVLDRGKVVERSPDGRALRMIGTHSDISARKAAEARDLARTDVMSRIAAGDSLPVILEAIVRDVELRCQWLCSILLVDSTGSRLVAAVAPSLPIDLVQAVDGLAIESDPATCTRAALTRSRVVSQDIRSDPQWLRFGDVAERAGLHACWSEPIFGADGTVLGTFANYSREPGLPTQAQVDEVTGAAQLASIAIERKRSEQALQKSQVLLRAKSRTLEATLERMEQGVMMVNPQRVVEVCNRRAIELLGLPPELMAGRPSFEQVLAFQWSTDEFAHTPEDLREFVRAGGILDQPQRYERRRPNGKVIEVQSVPIEGGGVLRTYTDITERQRADATRRSLEAQLLEARKLEAIGTLASGIAHDFNNIMAAVLGNVALARQDVGAGHSAQVFLEQIGKAGQRARSLVQQILAFSRQQPNELVGVSLRPLVEETVGMLRSMVGEGVRLQTHLPELRLAVRGNPTQLQQVLMNLGTNAWHALRDGGGEIDIGLAERDFDPVSAPPPARLEAGRYAHLWVRDDGHGMDEKTRLRIYEPFFTTKPVGQGTGLGLAVVHGIVESHGGAIEVASHVGRGTRFDVYLPLVEDESRPMPLDAAGADEARGNGEHVLYVDDDEVMAIMVQGLLQRMGYRCSYRLSARDALATLASDPGAFDLVVTDFNMPDLSGLDLVRALVALSPGLPAVISSGYISDELRVEASALGVHAVMHKERTLEELGGVIRAALTTEKRRH